MIVAADTQDEPSHASDALDAALAASDPPSMTVPVVATLGAGDPESAPAATAIYRVVRRNKADTAFSATDNRHSGRWTSEGTPAVYASLSPGGALLEFLTHRDGDSPADLGMVCATVPADCLTVGDQLPAQWRERPYRDDVRAYGDGWAKAQRSLAFQLPSVVCEATCNVLVNPEHPDAGRLQIRSIDPIAIDPRLRY